MRVTKNTKEFITNKVTDKINARYEEREKEAKRKVNILRQESKEVKEEINLRIKTILEEYFGSDDYEIDLHLGTYREINPLDYVKVKTEDYYDIKRKEIEDIVMDIVVTLELGGTKEDLDRMLAEI